MLFWSPSQKHNYDCMVFWSLLDKLFYVTMGRHPCLMNCTATLCKDTDWMAWWSDQVLVHWRQTSVCSVEGHIQCMVETNAFQQPTKMIAHCIALACLDCHHLHCTLTKIIILIPDVRLMTVVSDFMPSQSTTRAYFFEVQTVDGVHACHGPVLIGLGVDKISCKLWGNESKGAELTKASS